METTFHNVTIAITAIDSREAYGMLCSALASIGAEWSTDAYTTDVPDGAQLPTTILMAAAIAKHN